MDNCRSFHYLAPFLIQNLPAGTELVALDFPGHGLSSHKSVDGPPMMLAESAYYVAEAVQQLKWIDGTNRSKITMVGHSMGAGVSCIYSAAFPEQVDCLVLLEGAGPLARNTADIAMHVRKHVQRRMLGNLKPREPRLYESLEKAVAARMATATFFPGDQWLSNAAAKEMVLRSTRSVGTDGSVQFIHDQRLQWPSLQYFSIDQTEALYQNIKCPSAIVMAEKGWPFDEDLYKRTLNLLKPQHVAKLPGSHHFHADPETAEAVAEHVLQFIEGT